MRLKARRSATTRKAVSLALAYVAFASISTALNFEVQQVVLSTLTGRISGVLPVSILCGTIAGFGLKYVLDKNFIFLDHSQTHFDETRKLVLYGCFGVLTTLIFWGAELGAFYAFGTGEAKYIGGAIGIMIGYVMKFLLDRRYTFAT